ncbi:phosphatidylserine decarboxylase proenzyme, mitochondrial [Neodiprion pinetum]|uniref:Phosphatidylserine decarboxylase proenzyme, mitochondrial n=1 Tax=Neodiprion lecontei TaxID=441921 RepID=A0A6J0BWS3_NEOLC|nr:phosphatidylserine decarboxylase proenzyme, mitochondrial [Neodiprion lecontei]XP_046421374.1 phosphatidylserine decarboxylase proenzyme, mitochondrial [Neodiprion fabricii]XP_046480465.1 phosphatidylserine decarboxylase proenzyme, mitochondrial [Neodiprion pinetum]XP_046616996.1 phosphatidylserine decarboxylase proenzyme, mitochondrial [Neodiprion virginianus]XP_046616997.1 phosphatidylserine decarboxylase proenzyme, mitochondrial [Neodiprion virginianus]
MSVFRILRSLRYASIHRDAPAYRGRFQTEMCLAKFRRKEIRNYASNPSPTSSQVSMWHSFVKRRKWIIPVGVGISLLAVLQWKLFSRHSHAEKDRGTPGPINGIVVKCYCCLPLRITSRLWGWLASIEVPLIFRPTFYGLYAKAFRANLEEIDLDLTTFPNLVEFFVRPLKDGVRPIAQNVDIVSPADGKVLHYGPVTSCRVEQVKGVTYSLDHFLGDPDWPRTNPSLENIEDKDCKYLRSLLKNPENHLYQLIIYLAPGDYHRFHSPTDWQIRFRRHFQGKLLSVNPLIAGWLPDLFTLNERVVYIGEWAGGFMSYAAVGATNVGSIKVYCDLALATNAKKWPKEKRYDDASLGCTNISKGQMFGEFRMGSTIVLLFEAPPDFHFSLQCGQTIKVGQPLRRINRTPDK